MKSAGNNGDGAFNPSWDEAQTPRQVPEIEPTSPVLTGIGLGRKGLRRCIAAGYLAVGVGAYGTINGAFDILNGNTIRGTVTTLLGAISVKFGANGARGARRELNSIITAPAQPE